MILQDSDDEFMVIAAFRYALGRQTYAVQLVADKVKGLWDKLPAPTRQLIQTEIKEAVAKEWAGSEMDVRVWETLLTLPSE